MSLTFDLFFEDMIKGASNFIPWKERVTLLLEEFELWDISKEVVMILIDLDPLAAYNKMNVKEKCILLDTVKDQIMPYVTGKNNAFDVWVDLMKLY